MNVTIKDQSHALVGGTTLTTAEVDELLHALAEARAHMAPEISRSWSPEDTLGITNEPAVKIGLTADGTLLMALRHDGFGWCCFEFSLKTAAVLRDFIAKRTTGVLAQSVDDDNNSGGTPH